MSARQIIVLAVALVAAIGALFVIRGMASRNAAPEPTAQVETVNVLVAAREIQQGAAVQTGDLAWRPFPKESIGERFVQQSSASSALTDLTGAIARRAFSAGEPIINGYVIPRESGGFMAAMVPVGYRAVSVEVDRESLAGGFIQPNDHVDVMLSREVEVLGANGRTREERRTDIILENVRVLAIGDQVRPQEAGESPARIDGEIAVLELSQDDARLLQLADSMGNVSLVLRSIEQEAEGLQVASARRRGALEQNVRSDTVQVHAFSPRGGGSN
ncbi:MAG: Flp pilus assembly protein CpaB [Alphaproteobacteria bacterium]|nr:Flp pilus assembly protein CpaB [Alphaproteobacteria bacterium]